MDDLERVRLRAEIGLLRAQRDALLAAAEAVARHFRRAPDVDVDLPPFDTYPGTVEFYGNFDSNTFEHDVAALLAILELNEIEPTDRF